VDARDVDYDARRSSLEEALDRLARAEEGAPEVDADHLVEVRGRELVRRLRDLDAGVVDQDVEAAELVERVLEHAHDVVFLGDIALDEDVADAVLAHARDTGVNLLLGVLGLLGLTQIVDGDVCAVLGEADGDRLADTRCPAGDEDVLALESSHAFGRCCWGGCGHSFLLVDGWSRPVSLGATPRVTGALAGSSLASEQV
jgi:hypothetical protein